MKKKKNYIIPHQRVVAWTMEQHILDVSGHGEDQPWGDEEAGGNVREQRFENYNVFDTTW